MQTTHFSDILRKLPSTPGVYQFLDARGKIIYIGKAKVLKNRVKSYFQTARDTSPKTERMLTEAVDLKWIETSSEVEALVLETNLVKEHQPKYNVLLRDDKHFLYFKVTTNEDFPRVLEVRRVEKDGAKYFGPKTNSASVHDTLKLIKKLFHLRTCTLDLVEHAGQLALTNKTLKLPCLDAHLGLCPAPCVGKISKLEYGELVREVLAFLGGDTRGIIQNLKTKMETAATEKKFELAARLRDQIRAIQNVSERQLVSDPSLASRDVLGIAVDGGKAYLALLEIRDGKLIDQKNFEMRTGENEVPEILAGFLTQYYSLTTVFPREILLPVELEASETLEEFLNDLTRRRPDGAVGVPSVIGVKVKILFPQRGAKEGLLRLAEKNAAAFRVQAKAKFENATERTIGAARELAEKLGIPRELKRIEAYDISHLGGTATVGSMTVFERGEPKNADYRHFKIRTLAEGEIDDYASLTEVLGRRMSYLVEQNSEIKIRRAKKKELVFIREELIRNNFNYEELETSLWCVATKRVKHGEEIPSTKSQALEKSQIQNSLNEPRSTKPKKLAVEEIVGFVRERFHQADNFTELSGMWVAEESRHQGIASALIRHLLKKTKAKKIYLDCAPEKVTFYEQFGFALMKQKFEPLVNKLKRLSAENPENEFLKNLIQNVMTLVWSRKEQKQDPSFSAKPDLVILDGGKGQLSAVLNSVKFPKTTTVVALAKRNEELIKIAGSRGGAEGNRTPSSKVTSQPPVPTATPSGREPAREILNVYEKSAKQVDAFFGGDEPLVSTLTVGQSPAKIVPNETRQSQTFETIRLPEDSPAIFLVTRIRDEAHRFANRLRETIHKNSATVSELDSLPGVGEETRTLLLRHFGSAERVKSAEKFELIKLLGQEKGAKIYIALH